MIFRIGESVEVELEEATPLKGGLLFSLLDGGTMEASRNGQTEETARFVAPARNSAEKTLTHVH